MEGIVYSKAEVESEKAGSEALCVLAMKSHNEGVKYSNVIQIALDRKLDMDFHVDIVAEREIGNGKVVTRLIDVKSLSEKNLNTGNYCIGKRCYDTVVRDVSHVRDFAFRLVENGVLTGKFLIADACDVMTKCSLLWKGGEYCLVSIADVRAKCGYFQVEPDII